MFTINAQRTRRKNNASVELIYYSVSESISNQFCL